MWDVTDVGGTSAVWYSDTVLYLCTTLGTLLVWGYQYSVVPLYHTGDVTDDATRHTVISGGSIKYQVTSIERLLFIRFQELMIPHGTQWSLVRVPRSKY